MIGAYGAGPITELRLDLHEDAIGLFFQRLQGNPAPGHRRCTYQIAVANARFADERAQVDAPPLDLGPDLENPVVIAAREELPPVARNGGGTMADHAFAITAL